MVELTPEQLKYDQAMDEHLDRARRVTIHQGLARVLILFCNFFITTVLVSAAGIAGLRFFPGEVQALTGTTGDALKSMMNGPGTMALLLGMPLIISALINFWGNRVTLLCHLFHAAGGSICIWTLRRVDEADPQDSDSREDLIRDTMGPRVLRIKEDVGTKTDNYLVSLLKEEFPPESPFDRDEVKKLPDITSRAEVFRTCSMLLMTLVMCYMLSGLAEAMVTFYWNLLF